MGFDPAFNPYAPATSEYRCDLINYNDPDWLDPSCYYNYDPNCDGNYYYCDWVYYPSPYNSANAYRGNVTKVIRYAKPATQTEANVTTFKYDVLGNVTEESASCCRQRAYNYIVGNHYAYPAEVIRGAVGGTQLTTKATYDYNTGLPRESYDENNQKTTYNYFADSLRPYSSVRPDGGVTVLTYYDQLYNDPDAAHQHSYVVTDIWTTPTGNRQQSLVFYDGAGRVVRTMGHHYNSGSTTYRSITDTQYDAMGRVGLRGNPYYGSQGRLSPISYSGWTWNEYDPLGRATAVKFDDGNSVQTLAQVIFDSGTNYYVETVTDQAGKQRRRLTDGLGRLIEVHEPDASGNLGSVTSPTQKTRYQYDALDNVVKITQGNLMPEMQERFFKYDGLSRLTHERHVEQAAPHNEADPVSGNNYWSKKITYDLDGKVTDSLDARGTNAHFTYDTLNRVTQIDYSGGTPTVATPTVTYKYDEIHTGYYNLGKLTEVKTAQLGATPETKILYDYDLMGRVQTHQQVIGTTAYTTSYQYNTADQLTKETYPSGRQVTYTQTNGVGLTAISDSGQSYLYNLSYKAHGALGSEIFGNGAVHSRNYNNRLQLNQINLTKNGQELQRYDYAYGQFDATNTTLDDTKNNGQIAKIESSILGVKQWEQRHTYDSLGRLSVAGEYRGDNGQVSWRAQFGYDRFGNRYQSTAHNLNTGLSYVPVVENDIEIGMNRFKPTTGITYDNAGNVTADGKFKPSGTTYSYDATNRVVATNNSTAIYDGAGQRVQATEAGVTTTSVYDAAGQMIAEYVGGTMREYIYRGSEAIATVESAGVRYYLSDHLGSNRVVMDTAGGVIGRHDYQPFGEELGLLGMRTSGQGYGMNDPMRSKYAGMERETGGDHTLFRKAESKAGRWNRPDPYQGGFSNPQGANRYTYVENDPINATDPLGLSPRYDASFRGYDPDDRWKNPWNYLSPDMAQAYNAYGDRVKSCGNRFSAFAYP